MEHLTTRPLDIVAAPLFAMFGDALTFARDGNGVRWTLHGQAAAIDLRSDGTLDVRFFSAPTVDPIRGTVATGVYRPRGREYALTAVGCERMIADTVAFFSGAREPRFDFVDVR